MKKILIIIFFIIFISGCSNMNDDSIETKIFSNEIVNSKIYCENKANDLIPKYIKLDSGNILNFFIFNDNLTIGCNGDRCFLSNLNRKFNFGSNIGQNTKYLYSHKANRKWEDELQEAYRDKTKNKLIIYNKKIIENDIVLGYNNFEIDNLILKKVEIFKEFENKPSFNFSFNGINIDKNDYLIIVEKNNFQKGMPLENLEKVYDNLLNNIKLESFIISENKFDERDAIDFVNLFNSSLNQYNLELKKYNDFENLKLEIKNKYEVIEYEILDCNFVK